MGAGLEVNKNSGSGRAMHMEEHERPDMEDDDEDVKDLANGIQLDDDVNHRA